MQKIQELQVYLIDDVNNTILGRVHILYAHFFVGHWSLVDAGEISGFHSERNWLSTTDYVHVSFLLRLHTRRQRLPRSYFLRIRQCQFKYFRWRTRRLIHVCYHLQLEFFNFFTLTRFFDVVSLVSSACCTILCPTHLSRSSTSNVCDQPLVLVAISSSATDTTVLLWARVPLDSKNITDLWFLFTPDETTQRHPESHICFFLNSRYQILINNLKKLNLLKRIKPISFELLFDFLLLIRIVVL